MLIHQIRVLYWKTKRRYLSLLHPNLSMGYGTVITGKFTVSGRGDIKIGTNCRPDGVKLHSDGQLIVGDNCYLNHPTIYAKSSIRIGEACVISDAYIVDTDFHNLEPELRHAPPGPRTTRPVEIGRNVWIGDRGTILKGSRIGDDSVIGSMSVVRGPIPPGCVVIGNPARIVKYFCPNEAPWRT